MNHLARFLTLVVGSMTLAACSHVLTSSRAPAQASLTPSTMSPIVQRSSVKSSICSVVTADTDSCQATWLDAVQFCKLQGAHLPTAREYANLLKSAGTVTLEKNQVAGATPVGYYLVDCVDEDGTSDGFYMNHQGYKHPAQSMTTADQLPGQIPGQRASRRPWHLLWTASTPPGHPDYAHVLYDQWGGGGGDPADHLKTRKNSFQCVPNL